MTAAREMRSRAEPSGAGVDERRAGWVCVGVIGKPKGVRGAVRVTTYTARPGDVVAYGPVRDGPRGSVVALDLRETIKGGVVVAIAGVNDRDAAAALRGTKLYVPRSALPEPEGGEYYHADLIGLRAELADGSAFGTVHSVHNFGAGDILEVTRADGTPEMLPFTRAVVPEVDLAGGRVVVAPAEAGRFEHERIAETHECFVVNNVFFVHSSSAFSVRFWDQLTTREK